MTSVQFFADELTARLNVAGNDMAQLTELHRRLVRLLGDFKPQIEATQRCVEIRFV